jgi:D-glycerate 3-kinase
VTELAETITDFVAARAATTRPFVVGLSGPQGCGKSTVAMAVVTSLSRVGLRATAVSIDDFYLTRDEQRALAVRHAGNRYLEHRGYPGTHDVGLGARTIDALASLGPGVEMAVPTYDKSAHAGRGDRAHESRWRRVVGPLDVVLVEGWMLGFSPVHPATLEPELRAPNDFLGDYSQWTARLDALIVLEAPSLDAIVAWRIDAERARRERGEPALSDTDARDYIERFLPAYRAWSAAPCDLRIPLGDDRRPVALREPSPPAPLPQGERGAVQHISASYRETSEPRHTEGEAGREEERSRLSSPLPLGERGRG